MRPIPYDSPYDSGDDAENRQLLQGDLPRFPADMYTADMAVETLTEAPDEPSGTHGNGSGAVWCTRCSAEVEPEPPGRCPTCKVWLAGNVANLRHGLRRWEETGLLPEDVAAYRDDYVAEVMEDLGGECELSAIQRGLISSLGDLAVTRALQLDYALREGTSTKRGRQALADHGATVDRMGRLAKLLGLRRVKREVSVEEWVRRRAAEAREAAE